MQQPEGSVPSGFNLADSGFTVGETQLLFQGQMWVACPAEEKGEGVLKVLVDMSNVVNRVVCTLFEFRVYEGYEPCAWEYV